MYYESTFLAWLGTVSGLNPLVLMHTDGRSRRS